MQVYREQKAGLGIGEALILEDYAEEYRSQSRAASMGEDMDAISCGIFPAEVWFRGPDDADGNKQFW